MSRRIEWIPGGLRGQRSRSGFVALLAALLIASCGDEPGIVEGSAIPGETPAPIETVVPGFDEADGPIVVYAVVVEDRREVGRADYEVRAVDVASGRELSRFPVMDAWWIPQLIQLHGTRLYVTHLDRIAWYEVDGSASGLALAAPEGDEIFAFDLSDDGSRIAYWESPAGYSTPEQSRIWLVLADVATAEVLAKVEDFGGRADGEPAVMVDAFGQQVSWMPGGEAVMVDIGSSHDRSLRRVTLDGSVEEVIPRGRYGTLGQSATIAPSGTTALYPVSGFGAGCSIADPKDPGAPLMTRGIRDLEANTDFWNEPTDRYLWAAYGSPDGQSFLYAEYECPNPDELERHWRLVTTVSPNPVEVPDPLAVLRDWYGERLVHGRCDGVDMRPEMAFGQTWQIWSSTDDGGCSSPVELMVGGQAIDSVQPGDGAALFTVLGFIEPE